jgi:very-short-patch-repair endonuclease
VRLDLAYRRARVAVEYDGEEFHTSPEDSEHDEERRAALRRAGWIVIVVDRAGLTAAGRQAWLRELREALRERGVRV